MKKTIILILICFFSCKTENKTNSAIKNEIDGKQQIKTVKSNIETKYVIAKSGLNYRKEPKGEIIGKFDYSKKIEIILHSNIFEKIIDNKEIKRGEWLGVKFNNDTVYVFSAYLSSEEITIKPQNSIEILLPSVYRDWDNQNPIDNLNKNWVDLNKKESKYYIDKANYSIKSGEDDCTGEMYKAIASKNNTLIYIKNHKLKIGEVFSKDFQKDKIWPNEKIIFNYKKIEYTIRAEGDIISDEQVNTDNGLERYCIVENYKLFISTNKIPESIFLEEKSFDDTFVKLLFVGDIDSDSKLDFIFQANRNYEEERVILYLSTKASETEIIKKVAETIIGFDC